MGRWSYNWLVEYYSTGGFLKRTWIDAKTREDAIRQVREQDKVIEVHCCVRTDKWR